jgi:hypothetical protein
MIRDLAARGFVCDFPEWFSPKAASLIGSNSETTAQTIGHILVAIFGFRGANLRLQNRQKSRATKRKGRFRGET